MHCSSRLNLAQKRELEKIGPWLSVTINSESLARSNQKQVIRHWRTGDTAYREYLVGKRAEKIARGRSHHIICCAFIRCESSRKRC